MDRTPGKPPNTAQKGRGRGQNTRHIGLQTREPAQDQREAHDRGARLLEEHVVRWGIVSIDIVNINNINIVNINIVSIVSIVSIVNIDIEKALHHDL